MKKTLFGILISLAVLVSGYLFFYPYDYVVRFEADTFPGTINQSIKLWHRGAGVQGTEVVQDDLYHLEHMVQAGDSVHRYRWTIEPLTDSTSRVTVKITDPDHSFKNKLLVPFADAAVEKSAVHHVKDFASDLNDHLRLFRVQIEGEAELPGTFYAYVNLKTSQHGKAGGMMDHYMLLSDLLAGSQVTLNGPPMIVVNEWDREKDSLDFNFCFPIIRSDRLPNHPDINYKRIFPKKALKATYNGNYITSDRAWYALLDYAEKHGLEVEDKPVEVFYDNPNLGGDALRWKAEVYLPLREAPPAD
ncbi:GyrI-like domain-containing protein [Robiginitalea marina]|uniref:GyrI-like domain-containing protein n=1 Tax=Robiginitalea marina TaxID=2954105 RepID=A0ABT1AXH0_9FLAO|nr:GyrI-like domain-containing protein [Robiginitalea marina]MCO5724601.1 GyrI-like domain-containing protein [Robiginitalea marina]